MQITITHNIYFYQYQIYLCQNSPKLSGTMAICKYIANTNDKNCTLGSPIMNVLSIFVHVSIEYLLTQNYSYD